MNKAVSTLFAAGAAAIALPAGAIGSLDYEVEARDADAGIEVRMYAPYLVAEVEVDAPNQREASSRGFRPLAGYIFGDNTARGKIAMTSPVTTAPAATSQTIDMTSPVTTAPVQDGSEPGRYVVQFSMPAEWTMDTLPTPNDPNVRLREVASHRMMAIRFVGYTGPDVMAEAERRLGVWADSNGYRITGPATWAGYDGPRVRWDQRRYEMMVPVEAE